jgi:Transposase
MIDRHWDGIAAYCRPENKVSLGFVEGLNNKIRVASATSLSAYPGLVSRAWRAIAKRRTTCARRCSGSSIVAPIDRTRRLHINSEHMGRDGATIFAHACKLGFESIVSKRRDQADGQLAQE